MGPSDAGLVRLIAGLAVMVGLLSGCATTRSYQPEVDPNQLTEIQFVHYLESVPLVTFEEACRGLLITADGEDRCGDHAARLAELQRRGIVRSQWNIPADQALDLGTLSWMLVHAADVPPSVNSLLLGSWGLGDRRYAVKQAANAGLIVYAPPYKLVSGGEVVAALGETEDYLVARGGGQPSAGPVSK